MNSHHWKTVEEERSAVPMPKDIYCGLTLHSGPGQQHGDAKKSATKGAL